MKKHHFLLAIGLLIYGKCTCTNVGGGLEENKKDIKEAFDKFRKKDKKKQPVVGEEEEDTSNSQVLPAAGQDTNAVVSSVNASNRFAAVSDLKPGDVHPNAVYLDVDVMNPFNGGAAVVLKGSSYALINREGNYVVEFNKYNSIDPPYYSSDRSHGLAPPKDLRIGLFSAKLPNLSSAIINATGDEVAKEAYISECGKYAVLSSNGITVLTDGSMKKYKFNYSISGKIVNGKVAVEDRTVIVNNAYKVAYYDLYTQKLIPHNHYDRIEEPFSEGMALVSKVDQYNTTKYGFINEKGDLVIPCIYTNKPESFHSGLARVTPANNSEFVNAYINKKGEVVIKQTAKEGGHSFRTFFQGYAGLEVSDVTRVMDTTGKIYTMAEFAALLNMPSNAKIKSYVPQYEDGKLRYTRDYDYDNPKEQSNYGFVDISSKKSTGFVFSKIGYFDPVSKLAYAERYLGRGNNDNWLYTKGYINEDGIFVIVMAEKSVW